jgi:hypothetical protein
MFVINLLDKHFQRFPYYPTAVQFLFFRLLAGGASSDVIRIYYQLEYLRKYFPLIRFLNSDSSLKK